VLTIGDSNTTTFSDSNQELVFPDGRFYDGFCGIDIDLQNSSTTVTIDSCVLRGKGVTGADGGTVDTRPIFDVVNVSGTGTFDSCSFLNHNQVNFTSACSVNGGRIEAKSITQGNAEIENLTIVTSSATSVATLQDPTFGTTTGLHDVEFIQGGAGHALEIDTATSYTLTNITFTDYGATTSDSAAIDVTAASGTVTLNISGGTSPTYKTAGATVNVVLNPVSVTVTVKDIDTQAVISGARVLLWVSDGTNFPYEDSVTITGASTPEDNYLGSDDIGYSLWYQNTTHRGQSFQPTNSKKLTACRFRLQKTGTPPGNCYAELYTSTGTHGTNAEPTGSPLAVSNPVLADSLSTSTTWINFVFGNTQQYTMTASTTYIIVIKYDEATDGNYIDIAADNTSPTHGGNPSDSSDGTNWNNANTYDFSFDVYSDGTATVTHTTHDLASNDNVIIEGANEDVYNGVYQITVSDANTYTYTTNEAISTSPATGTITSTFAILNTTTDGSGQATDSRTYSSDQDVEGWVRKSSSSPYYKQQPIDEQVDSSSGLSITAQLISDE
jgi:hypothetical protein